MSNLLSYERDDYCNSCNSHNSIELYDIFDRPVNYILLLNKHSECKDISKVFDTRELSYFKCKKCNTIYKIDWRDNLFPKPFINLRGGF